MKQKKGFTVIELLVVVGGIGLFSTLLFSLFGGARRSQVRLTDDLQMQTRVMHTQNSLVRIIREGTRIVLPRLGEESSSLCIIDKRGDLQFIFPVLDEELSERFDRDFYKLQHYVVDIENFNFSSPSFDAGKLRTISQYVERTTFKPSSGNSVSIGLHYATENREFQVIFEAGLMNSGEADENI